MADSNDSVEKPTTKLEKIIESLPDQLQVVDENGIPYEGDDEIIIDLDDGLKEAIATQMLYTGETADEAIQRTVEEAIRMFAEKHGIELPEGDEEE